MNTPISDSNKAIAYNRVKQKRKESLTGYLYLAPGLIWIIFIYLVPMVGTVWISLTAGHKTGEGIGFQNYLIIFRDPLFRTAILK